MVRKTEPIEVKNARGGEGSVVFYHVLQEKELLGHGSMYAKVVVNPHSSIGWHQHVTNTEPYYILKGVGTFVDNDGTKTDVYPGDVCTIEVGQWHSMENNTDEDMEMIAFVMNVGLKF